MANIYAGLIVLVIRLLCSIPNRAVIPGDLVYTEAKRRLFRVGTLLIAGCGGILTIVGLVVWLVG